MEGPEVAAPAALDRQTGARLQAGPRVLAGAVEQQQQQRLVVASAVVTGSGTSTSH